jgi:hypothetical protein
VDTYTPKHRLDRTPRTFADNYLPRHAVRTSGMRENRARTSEWEKQKAATFGLTEDGA